MPKNEETTTAVAVVAEFSPREKKLLAELTKPGSVLEPIKVEDVNANELREHIELCCRAVRWSQLTQDRLLPKIGIMLEAVKAGKFFKEWGFKTFSDYVNHGLIEKFGIGRASAWEAKQLVDKWGGKPEILNQYADVGRVKFRILTSEVPDADIGKPYVRRLLEAAPTVTIEEFREKVEKATGAETGQTKGATLIIRTNKARARFFKQFFANEAYQAICESDREDVMLERAIQEASTEWDQQQPEEVQELAAS